MGEGAKGRMGEGAKGRMGEGAKGSQGHFGAVCIMETLDCDFEVEGEVIKMIHDELPAVRWTCGGCGEDACTIFYEPEAEARVVECDACHASNRVRRRPG